jgi:squalene-hopene/tetraprenyl-beta-curcumene cyclase
LTRLFRGLTRRRTLHLLTELQPVNGGFLEATPLTSFVTMSLAAMGLIQHPVTLKGIDFLVRSVRADGSWPIDTNLATWLTTLSVNALAERSLSEWLPVAERRKISDWLLGQQYRVEHPYTHAAPGGWAWTHLPGGVPDADDTSSALLALHSLAVVSESILEAAEPGVTWLLDLQNRDGGIPTFCKGWGKLPFDRSSPDLTAHAMRAWCAWHEQLAAPVQSRLQKAISNGDRYLRNSQRADGSWVPLWFGNQHAPGEENPTYGTSRVLICLLDSAVSSFVEAKENLARGTKWLLEAQNPDGGWSGSKGGPSSMEETAWALEGLTGSLGAGCAISAIPITSVRRAVHSGASWLLDKIESGEWQDPSPIGFYFAKLWYYEKLYPTIFAVGALGRVAALQKEGLI